METKLTVRIDLDLRNKAHEAAKELEETTLSGYVIKQIERLVREHEKLKPKMKKKDTSAKVDNISIKSKPKTSHNKTRGDKPIIIDIGL
ncbi:hypothetical protein [Photobacterium carnosum]|uniref:hypothetical protein n=1 Tax=Photobacterium carnosum TaxID=2023717 RepID=UPI001E3D2772|nr:hypothetical protein [Photobacterium carnosum]MCD9517129.1 hypothetical protein [Photobacterium carnosum]